MTNFTWMIGGEAGFGIMTTGLVFSKMATRSGYHIFDYIEYPSLIRGGHNAYEVHVADSEVSHLSPNIDVLVCLNKETYEKHKTRLTSSSLVMFDESEFEIKEDIKKVIVPFKKILSDLKGQPIMKNTIALGASIGLLEGDVEGLIKIITEQFSKKGDEVINFNKQFIQAGFDVIKKNYSEKIVNYLIKKPGEEKLVMTGNDAFSLGSVIADARVYVAYPMTPSSTVLTDKAYNLADVYQMPVIVMSDMYLSESHKSVSKKFVNDFTTNYKVNRGKLINKISNNKSQITNESQILNNKNPKYLRYQLTEDGISPRLIPGTPGYYYQANSYEHVEDGHTTEEAQSRIDQVDKRARKWATYLKNDFS